MRSRHGTRFRFEALIGVLALAAALVPSSEAQPTPATEEAPRALSIHYADGRITTRMLQATGGMWTPFFPRLAGAEPANQGLVLEALDLKHRVEGKDVIVTVSLLYGAARERRVEVSTRRLTPDAPVRVSELTAYGVEPVTLILGAVPEVASALPAVVSPSGALDIRVEPVAPGVPAYRVMISNESPQGLTAIDFEGYLGDRRILSGRRKDDRNRPLVQPGAQYAFTLTMSSGDNSPRVLSPAEWRSLDRFVVTSVMWADGVVEGDTAPAAQERALDREKARQLARVIALLGRASSQDIATVRSGIASLAIDGSIGMRQVKDAALRDIEAFEQRRSNPQSETFDEWRATAILEYERWLARVGGPISR